MNSEAYPPGAVVQSPDGLVNIDNVSKGVWEGRTFGDSRGHCRLEEIHSERLQDL